jgi:2-dehydropantoate 2-reductase
MRVAIVGLGAIGRVFVDALPEGTDLLKIDRTLAPLSTASQIGQVQALIVAVKTPGTRWAAQVASRLLIDDGIAVTIQNGLGNFEVLAEHLGEDRVVQGVAYMGAFVKSDGSLWKTGTGDIALACPPMRPAWVERRIVELRDLLILGGMTVKLVPDATSLVWRKLVVNAAINPTTALLGLPSGVLLESPAAALADGLARETAAVARASGVPISEREALASWRSVAARTAGNRSSMLQDVERGRQTEVHEINGAVVARAARFGITVPLNEAMVALVSALLKRQPDEPTND